MHPNWLRPWMASCAAIVELWNQRNNNAAAAMAPGSQLVKLVKAPADSSLHVAVAMVQVEGTPRGIARVARAMGSRTLASAALAKAMGAALVVIA
jgi:hypothetical protein